MATPSQLTVYLDAVTALAIANEQLHGLYNTALAALADYNATAASTESARVAYAGSYTNALATLAFFQNGQATVTQVTNVFNTTKDLVVVYNTAAQGLIDKAAAYTAAANSYNAALSDLSVLQIAVNDAAAALAAVAGQVSTADWLSVITTSYPYLVPVVQSGPANAFGFSLNVNP